MNLKRKAYQKLLKWKSNPARKPLLIRGARQVGKSTLVQEFAREFRYFISLNLEKREHQRWFEELDSIKDIMEVIALQFDIPIQEEPVLLFIDEIQESPKAIQQLRYFYEEMPGLYVIAAGSLLEFALRKVPSFPVGRVEQMVLHPFDFEEFLMALDHKQALDQFNSIPVKPLAHELLMKLFHIYAIIGGMPEIVKQYVTQQSMADLGPIYEALWQGYKDDVEKYAANTTERKVIRHVIDAAPLEKDRIKFEGFGRSAYRSREVGEALRALDLARIVRLIYPVISTELPMIEDIKRSPRLQFLDTGLLNYTLHIQAEMMLVEDFNDFYKGKIIQHLITQELQARFDAPSYKPNFWVREKVNSNAEVDLVYQHHKYLIPIEIKAGEQGRLRSLHQFVDESNHPYAVRLLANKLSVETAKTPGGKPYMLMNLPYYLGNKLPEYVSWFIENHTL
ncbi:MAG: ATP-binding protein [Bacteroidales bacterium]|nr:ATP-binding protein [Bacteroidales bacterium]